MSSLRRPRPAGDRHTFSPFPTPFDPKKYDPKMELVMSRNRDMLQRLEADFRGARLRDSDFDDLKLNAERKVINDHRRARLSLSRPNRQPPLHTVDPRVVQFDMRDLNGSQLLAKVMRRDEVSPERCSIEALSVLLAERQANLSQSKTSLVLRRGGGASRPGTGSHLPKTSQTTLGSWGGETSVALSLSQSRR